jgi:nitroimidazol reductase NimA-like FMN-containing flavoprotein (pyridoxamine 5'-phosphate oxidase superfamily)
MVARLGCHAEGRPHVVPVTYACDGEALPVQSADGLKVRMMRQNPSICVEIDHLDNLANWRRVIAWGRFEEPFGTGAAEAFVWLHVRLQPLIVSDTTPVAETLAEGETRVGSGNGHASIYRIHLFEKTGRFERR